MHSRGKFVILVMLGIAAVMTAIAVWYNHERTHRAIQLWTAEHANRITQAPTTEVIRWTPPRSEPPTDFLDGRRIDDARGLINVRRSLTEDISYEWDGGTADCSPAWEYALVLCDAQQRTSRLLYAPNCRLVRLVETGATAVARPEFAKVLDAFFGEQFPQAN
jgi:hypothetical protein